MTESIYFWYILTIGLACIFAGIKIANEARNTMPYGKKAVRKFAEKVDRIYDANRISKEKMIPNKSGVFLAVEVVEKDTGKGLEYETIPMHKCKAVYINDEEVVRVHSIHSNCNDHLFLEFTNKRKMSEIIEIVDGAYNMAEPIYQAHHDKVFRDKYYKSFYTGGK